MNIEQQVCSRPLAERMKELGFPQESYLKWYVPDLEAERKLYEMDDDEELGEDPRFLPRLFTEEEWTEKCDEYTCECEFYPAFDASELGEMLPAGIRIQKAMGGYNVFYDNEDLSKGYSCGADTLSEAMGEMFYHLKENKLI